MPATFCPDPQSGVTVFTKVVLFADSDGRAKFREQALVFSEGSPQATLSPLFPSGGYQLRHRPVGFRSQFHCTVTTQWRFVLGGQMAIGLQDGPSRLFGPGDLVRSRLTPEAARPGRMPPTFMMSSQHPAS